MAGHLWEVMIWCCFLIIKLSVQKDKILVRSHWACVPCFLVLGSPVAGIPTFVFLGLLVLGEHLPFPT